MFCKKNIYNLIIISTTNYYYYLITNIFFLDSFNLFQSDNEFENLLSLSIQISVLSNVGQLVKDSQPLGK